MMVINSNNLAAVIPAAGKASRMSPLPFSKELLTIGFDTSGDSIPFPKTVTSHLIEGYRNAGINNIHIILRKGKWDIPEYFQSGTLNKVNLAYHLTEMDAGVPFTVDQAYPFYQGKMIAFGFPDIIFFPKTAYKQLLEVLMSQTKCDILLGLFPVKDYLKWDMVQVRNNNSIEQIIIKNERAKGLKYAWISAVWKPVFSDFLHEQVQNMRKELNLNEKEVFMGDVVQKAINSGLHVLGYPFDDGKCLDVGTPEGYAKAQEFIIKQ